MKTFRHSKILASVSCALALAACDSIKDVQNEDFAGLPAQTVVLSGQIKGLSSLRAITLQNNNDIVNTRSFINAAPTTPNEGVRPVPFSFGSIAVGSPYNITVKDQPEFKNCVVVNGQGVITLGVRPDVVVNCTTTGPRYDLTVYLPSTEAFFKSLAGAKVRVTTEEEIREVAVTPSMTSVFFDDVLISAPGALNPATYSVTASTFEGNRLNKCVVTFPSNTNPSGNVVAAGSAPVIGAVTGTNINAAAPACQFTVGGRVGYSVAPGSTAIPAIAGLKLQLRDLQMNSLQEIDIPTCNPPAPGTVRNPPAPSTTTLGAVVPQPEPTNANCSYNFTTPVRSSSTDGVYEVAVSQHPAGQFCVVVNGGSVSVFTQGLTPPVNVTNANVFCRATPPANRQLRGVFRLQTTTFVSNAITNSAPVVVAWRPFDLTQWNVASSNMVAFFDNGTFLHGTHANTAQAEHGFYDYNPAAQTLRFTSIVDTNPSTVFPANFSPVPTVAANATFTINTNLATTTPGLSALPNPIRQNGITPTPPATATANFAASHAAMTGVTFGTVQRDVDGTPYAARTISGTFGADSAGIATYQAPAVACSTAAPCWNPTTNAATVTTGTSVTGACSAATPCLNASTGASITTGYCGISPNPTCARPDLAYRVSWVLEEPPNLDGEMTGAWVMQDSRRLFVYDYRTYYGFATGMAGGSPSLNDACYSTEQLHESTGIFGRRASTGGCFPFARPANDAANGLPGTFGVGRNGTLPGYFASQNVESVDLNLAGLTPLVQLPGFTGRFPGGETFTLISSPSPIFFHIAPAATFFTSADDTYFPDGSASWCTTEILGLRTTSNGFPTNYPLYYCRTRASLP